MIKMGLEVTRILARANGSFQSRKMKNSTLGMSSRRSQYRTLEDGHSRRLSGGAVCTPARLPPTHTDTDTGLCLTHTHSTHKYTGLCLPPPNTRMHTHAHREPLSRAGPRPSPRGADVLVEQQQAAVRHADVGRQRRGRTGPHVPGVHPAGSQPCGGRGESAREQHQGLGVPNPAGRRGCLQGARSPAAGHDRCQH